MDELGEGGVDGALDVVAFGELADGAVECVDFGAPCAAEVFAHAGVVGGGGWNEVVEEELEVVAGGVGFECDFHGVGDGVEFVDDAGHDVAGVGILCEVAVGDVEECGEGVERAVVGDFCPEDGGDFSGVDGGESCVGHGLDDLADACDGGFAGVFSDGGGVCDDGDFGGSWLGQPCAVDGACADGLWPADGGGNGLGVAESVLVGADEGIAGDEVSDGVDGVCGVVAFDGDDDEVESGLKGVGGGLSVDLGDVVVAPDAGDAESVVADGVHVGLSSDEGDVVSGFGHESADGGADGAGAHDENAHGWVPCVGLEMVTEGAVVFHQENWGRGWTGLAARW